jgi:hypothetical protein
MLPTWLQYHEENKNSMSMNEMIRQYNFLYDNEHMADTGPIDALGRPLGFLIQENLDYLLQEDGSRIYWN